LTDERVAHGWGAETLDELRVLYEPTRRYAAVVGRWDVEPDDLVQEAYTRVLRVAPGHIRDTRAYLRRTVLNLAMNERRRVRRAVIAAQRARPVDTRADDYPSELDDLMRLEPRVRGLLYLVEVEGEPIGAAAEAVGMSAPAARMALTRARRRLRNELHDELHDEERDEDGRDEEMHGD
jgi:DNA-directed RNA polymerase specialized sigma24 family protein